MVHLPRESLSDPFTFATDRTDKEEIVTPDDARVFERLAQDSRVAGSVPRLAPASVSAAGLAGR